MNEFQTTGRFSQFRLWLKYMVFSLVPLVVLFLAGTAVLDFLESREVIETVRQDDRVGYVTNDILSIDKTDQGDFWVIQDTTRDNPGMVESRFPMVKAQDTFRIIITGGSFAMGDPYVDPVQESPEFGGIRDWLDAILTAQYPSKHFEVINAAAGGQNSARVRQIVDLILQTSPDLVIVATGNNEGYVPATGFNETLHKWVLYRALKKTLLDEPTLKSRRYFPPQDPDSQQIESQFQQSISGIVELAQKSGTPLALCTLPLNLKYQGPIPGELGEPTAFPKDDPAINKAQELMAQKKYTEAIVELAESPHQAFSAKLMGECFEALGQKEKAAEFYKIYVQQNPLGRTRPSYNQFIRDISKQAGVILVDLEKVMETATPRGISGDRYFWDNCHLTWQGYFLMAENIVSSLEKAKAIPAAKSEPAPYPALDKLIELNHWQMLYTFKPILFGHPVVGENEN